MECFSTKCNFFKYNFVSVVLSFYFLNVFLFLNCPYLPVLTKKLLIITDYRNLITVICVVIFVLHQSYSYASVTCSSIQVFHKRMPPEAIDLASRLLQYSPSLRCTAVSWTSIHMEFFCFKAKTSCFVM